MSRIWSGVVALVAVTTLQVTAQQSNPSGPRSTPERSTVARIDPPRILPGTPSEIFSTIQGSALTANNSALANAFVRLRDARIGQIIETQMTNQAGLFAFDSIDPGSYVVEIVDDRQASVLGASQVLNAGPGEAISTVIRLAYHIGPFAAVFGTSPAMIGIVTAQAASAGVLAVQVAGTATCELVR